ncbi:MAG: acyl carrier protein [Acidimicrobiales bacterium]
MTNDDALSVITTALGGIAPEADLTTVDPDEPLQDELDLDSMDFLNLMVAIAERTGIEVPERDYPMVSTLAGLTTYLVSHAPA